MPYVNKGDNGNGMTSFTWQDNRPKTYRIIWKWRGEEFAHHTGVETREQADAMCKTLNLMAKRANQEDEYTVEPE